MVLRTEKTKFAKGAETGISSPEDDMIQDFNLEQLSRPNQVACNLDVRLGGAGLS